MVVRQLKDLVEEGNGDGQRKDRWAGVFNAVRVCCLAGAEEEVGGDRSVVS